MGGVTGNKGVPLTPDLLRSSLERSLQRLGTDHVDVYALHNADPADLERDDILRTLEDLVAAGKTRGLGVAGDADAARAALARGAPFDVVQLAQPTGATPAALPQAATDAGLGCVTHTVFGVGDQFADLDRRLRAAPDALE